MCALDECMRDVGVCVYIHFYVYYMMHTFQRIVDQCVCMCVCVCVYVCVYITLTVCQCGSGRGERKGEEEESLCVNACRDIQRENGEGAAVSMNVFLLIFFLLYIFFCALLYCLFALVSNVNICLQPIRKKKLPYCCLLDRDCPFSIHWNHLKPRIQGRRTKGVHVFVSLCPEQNFILKEILLRGLHGT